MIFEHHPAPQADNLEAMYKCRLACHQMCVALLAGPHQQQVMVKSNSLYLNPEKCFEKASAQEGL